MNLIKYRNRTVPSIENWLDEIFKDDLFSLKPMTENFSFPRTNVWENDNDYSIELVVPGFSKEQFKTEVDKNLMKISAVVEEKHEEEEKNTVKRIEYTTKAFSKTFNLPHNVNTAEISAEYVNGILRLTLPKLASEKSKTKRLIDIG